MNFNPVKKTIQTIINKPRTIIITACMIAAVITLYKFTNMRQQAQPVLSYKCFNTGNGWGYDILCNDSIIIHQDVAMGVHGTAGFSSEQQAKAVAAIVIEKIKSGKIPTITRRELQQPAALQTP